MINNLPPQNIEAEESILGCILLDPEAINKVVHLLSPQSFYVTAHRQIYEAVIDLHHKHQPIDLMTIMTWLSDHNILEKIGGQSKLVQLIDRTVSSVNVDRYAELVLDKYHRRQLIKASNQIAELSYDMGLEIGSLLQQSEEQIFRVTQTNKDRFEPELIGDCLVSAWNEIEQGEKPGISSGLNNLDKLIGALVKQDLIVIAGRASMGKTWLGFYLANHVSLLSTGQKA